MKRIINILILVLVFLIIPTNTVLACGDSSDKAIMDTLLTKNDKHTERKSCCESEESDGDCCCGDTCKDLSCQCPGSLSVSLFINLVEISILNNFILLDNDWAYVQAIPKAIYLSIWQPPKIS